jgi:hypothetical protein
MLPVSVGGSNARTGQAITASWPGSSPLIFPRFEIAHASGPAACFWDARTLSQSMSRVLIVPTSGVLSIDLTRRQSQRHRPSRLVLSKESRNETAKFEL